MADTRTQRALIIAEAGVNHDGNIEQALQLIDVAADAGAGHRRWARADR